MNFLLIILFRVFSAHSITFKLCKLSAKYQKYPNFYTMHGYDLHTMVTYKCVNTVPLIRFQLL